LISKQTVSEWLTVEIFTERPALQHHAGGQQGSGGHEASIALKTANVTKSRWTLSAASWEYNSILGGL